MLIDPFGRPIPYLRISLTPRCNLRCVYCVPAEGLPVRAESLPTTTESVSLVTATGVPKVRRTGGEPLSAARGRGFRDRGAAGGQTGGAFPPESSPVEARRPPGIEWQPLEHRRMGPDWGVRRKGREAIR